MSNFEKIEKILKDTNAPLADKNIFLQSCQGVIDENLELLADLFSENPEWIEKIIENFKEKREAAYERNLQRWNEIIDTEVCGLEDMNKLDQLRTATNTVF